MLSNGERDKRCMGVKRFPLSSIESQLMEVNGYEVWQNSLFYVFVRFFGLDLAQIQ